MDGLKQPKSPHRQRRRPRSFPTRQGHGEDHLVLLFLITGSVFRDTHRKSTKMDLKHSTSPPRICSVHRWMVVISRHVTRSTESYVLTVRIQRWSQRSPATVKAEAIADNFGVSLWVIGVHSMMFRGW